MQQDIEGLVFWDYGANALNVLPKETVAQRLVDRWGAIDVAYHNGKLTRADMLEILRRIALVKDAVIYAESVREFVIKEMIRRYVENTAPIAS